MRRPLVEQVALPLHLALRGLLERVKEEQELDAIWSGVRGLVDHLDRVRTSRTRQDLRTRDLQGGGAPSAVHGGTVQAEPLPAVSERIQVAVGVQGAEFERGLASGAEDGPVHLSTGEDPKAQAPVPSKPLQIVGLHLSDLLFKAACALIQASVFCLKKFHLGSEELDQALRFFSSEFLTASGPLLQLLDDAGNRDEDRNVHGAPQGKDASPAGGAK